MNKLYISAHNDLLAIWQEISTGRLFIWYSPQYGWTQEEDITNFATTLTPR